MLNGIIGRLTYANVMSTLAVFGTLATGGAFAASQIATHDIKNGAVTASKLHRNAVTAQKIRNGAVTGVKVAPNSLTGVNIVASSLGVVPSANHANSANSATNAANLGGSPASAYVMSPVGPAQMGTLPAVRVSNSGDEAVSSGGFTFLTFNTSQYDNAGMHSSATNTSRVTAPISGVYEISGQVAWAGNGTGSRELIIAKNEGPFVARSTVPVTSTGAVDQQISTQVNLSAGDYVELIARQDTGGSLSVLAGDNEPILAMHWLGP